MGDPDGARARFSEALTLAKAMAAERVAGVIAASLAELEYRGGDAQAALRLATEALDLGRELFDTTVVTAAASNMAAYLLALERYDEARIRARQALMLSRDLQAEVIVTFALQHLCAIAALRANDDAVDARLAALEALREYTEQLEYDRMLASLRRFGESELSKLLEEGGSWSEDQAVAEAMLI